MRKDDGDGIEKRAHSPTAMPLGPNTTRNGATPPPGGGSASQTDGEKSDAPEGRPTAEVFQHLLEAAVPKLKTLVRNCSEETLALNGEIRPCSPRSEGYSSGESSWLSDSSWLSEDSTVPSNHGAHQAFLFDYPPSVQSTFSEGPPVRQWASPGGARVQERRKGAKGKGHARSVGVVGGGAVQGKGIALEACDGLMVLEDCPATTAASSVLHEREARFVRRCGQPCRHYAMWRMKKESATVALMASLLRKCVEAALAVAPLVLASLCLLYAFSLEEPDTWDRELVSIPLLNAAESGDARQVELLLNNGANIEQRNYYGLTALHRASEEGKVPVVKLLLSRGADVQSVDCDGQSALEKAAQQGHKRTVGLLARWGGDVHFRDSMGYTLLMRAAEWGWHHVMLTLLQAPQGVAELKARDLFDETPLLKAARNGRRQVVQTLLKHGAEVGAMDKEENTVLLWAVRNAWEDLIPPLLSACALSPRQLNRGLAVAVKRGLTAVAALLLRHGADPAIRDAHGKTLLMRAAQGGHEGVARLLLKHGADPDAVNARQQTALMLAAERDGTLRVAALLAARRASLNRQDKAGETALAKAVVHGHVSLVKALLGRGASAAIPDKHGASPLRRAAMEGNRELVSLLVSRQPRRSAWELLGELAVSSAEAASLRASFNHSFAAREWANTPPPPPPAPARFSLVGSARGEAAEDKRVALWREVETEPEEHSDWPDCAGDGECGPDGLETEDEEQDEQDEGRGLWARVRRLVRWRRHRGKGAMDSAWTGEPAEWVHSRAANPASKPPVPASSWGLTGVGAWLWGWGGARRKQTGHEHNGAVGVASRGVAREGWTVLGLRTLWRSGALVWRLVRDSAAQVWRLVLAAATMQGPARAQREEEHEDKGKPDRRGKALAQRGKEAVPWWRWRGGGLGLVRRSLEAEAGAGAGREGGRKGGRSVEAKRERRHITWGERVTRYGAWLRDKLIVGGAEEGPGRGGERRDEWRELRGRMPSETACLVERVLKPWLPFQAASDLCSLRHHLIHFILSYGEELHDQEMQQLGIGADEEDEEEELLSAEDKVEEADLFGEEEGWGDDADAGPEPGSTLSLDGFFVD